MTLDEYLRKNLARGVIAHALRAEADEVGIVSFHIRPANVSGDTLDCFVWGNECTPKNLPSQDK